LDIKNFTTTPAEEHCGAGGHDTCRRTTAEEPPLENAGRARDTHCGAGVHDGKEIKEKVLSIQFPQSQK
jgi:hypothetical protein